jgi:hypothetical protein
VALLGGLLALGGCGPDHHHGGSFTKAPRPPAKSSPGSGLFAVDCANNKAYVPLDTLDGNEDGQVSVINLAANPNTTDPRTTTIALTHSDIPTGTALDADHGLILVVGGGFVDVIDEATNTLVAGSPFALPNSGSAGSTGQILYNPTTHLAIVALATPASGFVTFDPVTHVFGTPIAASYAEAFSLNSATNVVMDGSDSTGDGSMDVIDIGGGRACTLTDINIGSDLDGASTDSGTNITIISNEDGTASVLNLQGAVFNPGGSVTPCTLDEANAPNSVLVSGLPTSTAGSAVNGVTHQAFLIEDDSNGVSLIQLPSNVVSGQLQPGQLGTPKISTIPNTPLNTGWATQGDPYAVAIGECNNQGYAVDSAFDFLVQVDLTTLKNTPGNIATALPAGNCAGTSTTFSCSNGSGVTFYPLPGVI